MLFQFSKMLLLQCVYERIFLDMLFFCTFAWRTILTDSVLYQLQWLAMVCGHPCECCISATSYMYFTLLWHLCDIPLWIKNFKVECFSLISVCVCAPFLGVRVCMHACVAVCECACVRDFDSHAVNCAAVLVLSIIDRTDISALVYLFNPRVRSNLVLGLWLIGRRAEDQSDEEARFHLPLWGKKQVGLRFWRAIWHGSFFFFFIIYLLIFEVLESKNSNAPIMPQGTHIPPAPPPPPPRRWWGFHQGGWSNLSGNPTPCRDKGNGQTDPPRGRQRPVCLYDSVLWISQGTRTKIRQNRLTDDGQCASVPRNPPHSQTPHPG